MTKKEIIIASENAFKQFSETCLAISDEKMFARPADKWSVAENIQHLVISTKMTALAYALPKFMVKWAGGTPNRRSKTFAELKDKYYRKLSEGAKASARYVPKPLQVRYGKQRLLDNWKKATSKYLAALTFKRTEQDLDNYLAKHPLLGRLTLRELCYFTLFHTQHHLNSIQKLTQANDPILQQY